MKNIQKILWLGLLVSAVGCNSGVFIDDYLPEVPVVQLSETDSVARINFKSDNWDILNIYGASENVWGVVCMGHRTKRFFQWSGKMGERF